MFRRNIAREASSGKVPLKNLQKKFKKYLFKWYLLQVKIDGIDPSDGSKVDDILKLEKINNLNRNVFELNEENTLI